ncbi:Pisatin demethylase [Podospora fimiseda]|uniref:Pisatin demethylase n=1 Tax=Podospora fimiseda TaxID=252190 RepID=A0AAN6YPW9_9PEZI|nr:Pisatin demethylase [Podospora fimiseda]
MHPLVSLIITPILWFITLLTLTISGTFIYRLFLHPLARIPGPKLAAISNIWQARYARDGRVRYLALTLQKKYGPMVRVGPNEVWVCDGPEVVKQIYGAGGGGWGKSRFYWATALSKPVGCGWKWKEGFKLKWGDTLDLLSEFDVGRYKLQRRMIGPVYSAGNVKKYEGKVETVMQKVIEELRKEEEYDLKMWMHIIAVEMLGEVVLGWSPGYLKQRSDGGTSGQSYNGWKRKSVFGLFPVVTAVGLWSRGVSRFWGDVWGVTFGTPKGFKTFFTPVYQKCSKRITNALRRKGKKLVVEPVKEDLLEDLIKLHLSRPEEFTETYLRRLAVTNFGAGHETLCATLTSVVALIASHPEVKERVCQEVRTSDDFTYTKAAIKEAQRLWPVIGMSLARRVPAGVTKGGEMVAGWFLPTGTTVGCNPVALHRDETIFGPETEKYKPERWLLSEEGEDRLRVMERCNLIYGGGARTCPGKYLAEMMVLRAITGLFKEFDVQVTVMPKEEEMPCYFMAMMSGVKVKFRQKGSERTEPEACSVMIKR